MIKPNVPKEWADIADALLLELDLLKLDLLKQREDFETLNILYVREKEGHLRVAYELEPDIDELYEIIHNIIKKYEKHMQAISFTKTSNIQGNTGGDCSAF